MASLIHCPHCGPRPREEFTVRGAAMQRPMPDDSWDDWFAYVYLRENPRGPHREHWQHTGGCRRWLEVTRNTATHETLSVRDAALGTEARP
ncbi:N-methylglutamate dehydrogenase subunit B [Pseudoxanthobacter soli DSM 19599]|uniref:N-methylglutamate dehydrogenase subunit B n=1 Tax=Pseudoxanthobacter soli DSM 19599 TaxID=1123029 RepID=A0A1M7ZQS6_9HYPH|nr:sarcosine oxidase subunit delta [Pseudoxanthobacter soli]SHO67221.1 N-methylglutamate dehydrogenase subunit B [Pseudoxanthobacter soli DSM 19599]